MEFLDAYGALDAERALTYLSDEAVAGMSSGTPESFRLELALLEAQGYEETITRCEQRGDSSSGTTVRCAYDFHGIRSDEMGLGPYSDNYWELTVRDGKIVAATNTIAFETNGFSEQVWEPFAEWVARTYPRRRPANVRQRIGELPAQRGVGPALGAAQPGVRERGRPQR